jgi:Rab proteins geranylgeranyltransferase component A
LFRASSRIQIANGLFYSGIIYASTKVTTELWRERLANAVERLLNAGNQDPVPTLLWSISYLQRGRASSVSIVTSFAQDESGQIITLPAPSLDLAFDDALVDSVRAVWKKIMGVEADNTDFLLFQERESNVDDDDDDDDDGGDDN